MKLATWNVNSVRTRLERLERWLKTHQPDVLCLQETKATDEQFPRQAVEDLGYKLCTYGQKTYNGVAILSREEPTDVQPGWRELTSDDVATWESSAGDASKLVDTQVQADGQARLLAATVGGVRVLNAYVPNGSVVGSEKYAYKLRWLSWLRAYLEQYHEPSQPLVLCGDFNVAPDDRDVNRVDEWADGVLCHSDVRRSLTTVMDWGLTDVFRKHHEEGGLYSWWDYRMLGFPKNNGLRIDLILATHDLAAASTDASIDRDERKGKQPSDHAPVIATF